MTDLEVVGTADFVRVANQLRALGKDGMVLRRELRNELKDAARPMGDAVREHVALYVPSGYAPVLAAAVTVTPMQSLRGATAGLKLRVTAKGRRQRRQVGVIDKGILRHPVYGNRDVWVSQRVKPGFASDPLYDSSDEARDQIQQAIRKAIEKVGL